MGPPALATVSEGTRMAASRESTAIATAVVALFRKLLLWWKQPALLSQLQLPQLNSPCVERPALACAYVHACAYTPFPPPHPVAQDARISSYTFCLPCFAPVKLRLKSGPR